MNYQIILDTEAQTLNRFLVVDQNGAVHGRYDAKSRAEVKVLQLMDRESEDYDGLNESDNGYSYDS